MRSTSDPDFETILPQEAAKGKTHHREQAGFVWIGLFPAAFSGHGVYDICCISEFATFFP